MGKIRLTALAAALAISGCVSRPPPEPVIVERVQWRERTLYHPPLPLRPELLSVEFHYGEQFGICLSAREYENLAFNLSEILREREGWKALVDY